MDHAVNNDHLPLVQYLCEQGADKEARDRYDRAPLHVAAIAGRMAMAEILLNRDGTCISICRGEMQMRLSHVATWLWYISICGIINSKPYINTHVYPSHSLSYSPSHHWCSRVRGAYSVHLL